MPHFPFSSGLTYLVDGERCSTTFTVPAQAAPPPEVVGVYPSAAVIPENVLRFYVRFSQPMAEGDFLRHIHLERVDTGEDLTGVFFDNIHELWSTDRKRITLLVDPGRVKTGLIAHQARGRAFQDGGQYRLHIQPTWTSARGKPLAEGYVHSFRATAEDRERVDVERWALALPEAGTQEALRIDFGEPVDHVSVHRLIRVRAPDGAALEGTWELGPEERTAWWTPAKPWRAPMPMHALVVSGRFEDVAANNLNAAMDHALGGRHPGDEGRPRTRLFR